MEVASPSRLAVVTRSEVWAVWEVCLDRAEEAKARLEVSHSKLIRLALALAIWRLRNVLELPSSSQAGVYFSLRVYTYSATLCTRFYIIWRWTREA